MFPASGVCGGRNGENLERRTRRTTNGFKQGLRVKFVADFEVARLEKAEYSTGDRRIVFIANVKIRHRHRFRCGWV